MRAKLKELQAWLRALLKLARDFVGLREVLLILGAGCVARGLHEIYPPAAWIFVGVLLILLALRRGAPE